MHRTPSAGLSHPSLAQQLQVLRSYRNRRSRLGATKTWTSRGLCVPSHQAAGHPASTRPTPPTTTQVPFLEVGTADVDAQSPRKAACTSGGDTGKK